MCRKFYLFVAIFFLCGQVDSARKSYGSIPKIRVGTPSTAGGTLHRPTTLQRPSSFGANIPSIQSPNRPLSFPNINFGRVNSPVNSNTPFTSSFGKPASSVHGSTFQSAAQQPYSVPKPFQTAVQPPPTWGSSFQPSSAFSNLGAPGSFGQQKFGSSSALSFPSLQRPYSPTTGNVGNQQQPARWMSNKASGSGGNVNPGGQVPKVPNSGQANGKVSESIQLPMQNRNRMGHIFRDAPGHFKENTPQNQKMLADTANNGRYLGNDKWGNKWYDNTLPDGRQVWVQVRGKEISNGGINTVPRTYNPETGLTGPSSIQKP